MASEVGVILHPELYRIRDAAAVLAVSPRTVYSFIETGALRAVRLPGQGSKRQAVRIARADLVGFVASLRGPQ
jgi:excisionase family DNA binding protein